MKGKSRNITDFVTSGEYDIVKIKGTTASKEDITMKKFLRKTLSLLLVLTMCFSSRQLITIASADESCEHVYEGSHVCSVCQKSAGSAHKWNYDHVCTMCGKQNTEKEHIWIEEIVESYESCTSDGVYHHPCVYCGYDDVEIVKGGHGYVPQGYPSDATFHGEYNEGPIYNDFWHVHYVGATPIELKRYDNPDVAVLYAIECNWCGEVLDLSDYDITFSGTWGEVVKEAKKPTIEGNSVTDLGWGSQWWYSNGDTWTFPADTFAGWDALVGQVFSAAKPSFLVTTPYLPFDVTFVDWDGTVLKEEEVPLTKTEPAWYSAKYTVNGATAPDAPARAGYKFVGWDKDFSRVTSDMVITAQYEPLFTVTYTDGVEGQELFADQVTTDIESGTATPAFDGTPARENYVFIGWDSEVAATVTADAVYTAQWEELPKYDFAVIYNGNGGTLAGGESFYTDGESVEQTYAESADFGVDENGFARPHFTFTGWNTAADGSGTAYAAEDTVALNVAKRSLTLYAQWADVPYDYTVNYFVRVDEGAYEPFTGTAPTATSGTALFGQVIDAAAIAAPATIADDTYTYQFVETVGITVAEADNVVNVYYQYTTPVVEIPEDDVPLAPEPPVVEIPEDDVPLAPAPQTVDDDGLVDLPDEEVPLAAAPTTGDPMLFYGAMTALSGAGLLCLRKKRDEE